MKKYFNNFFDKFRLSFFIKIILITLAAHSLSSCSSKSKAQCLNDKIIREIKHSKAISNGDVVAKFDLLKLDKSNKIFSSEFGRMINDSAENSKFLHRACNKHNFKNEINSNASTKAIFLANKLQKLNNSYKILPPSINRLISKIKNNKNKNQSYNYLCELHNKTKNIPVFTPIYNSKITSKYGLRKHPYKKKNIHHRGLDIAGKKKSPIFAAADGIVESTAKIRSYGNTVIIRHSNQIKTLYAHLSQITVKTGDKVILGEKIGYQGATGRASGEHLHFEVRIRGRDVNPQNFLDF